MIDELKNVGSHGRFSGEDPAIEEKSNLNVSIKNTSFFQLFRFASKVDWILMVLGFIAAIGRGPSYLFLGYFLIGVIDTFIAESNNNETVEWSGPALNTTGWCNVTINGPTILYE